MKNQRILRSTILSLSVLFALLQLHAAGTSVAKLDGVSKGLSGVGDALPAIIIVVTNTNDSGPGSLRDALAAAIDGDTIDATGVSGTILLTSGELQINHNVTINGPGAGSLAVNGNATSRVFENFASHVTISGFAITNGNITDVNGGGGILNHGGLAVSDCIVSNSSAFADSGHGGGGISNNPGATLTVTGSTISGNFGLCDGGGIYTSNARLTVTNSVLSGNNAFQGLGCGGIGGGIFYNGRGTVTVMNSVINGNGAVVGGGMGGQLPGGTTAMVTDSTISTNTALSYVCQGCGGGGGISNDGQTLTVTNSTISDNGAGFGGGGGISNISNTGSVTVINSTISGNATGGMFPAFGGGIDNGGTLTLTNSSLSDNSAGPGATGGDVFNGGTMTIKDTVLNTGASGGTINNAGTFTSLGYNLANDDGGGVLTGPGDQINTDPMLGPLQDNGGPTYTHALLPGSPAINAGDPSFTPPPFHDQRGPGFRRMRNGRIDIGSYEVQ